MIENTSARSGGHSSPDLFLLRAAGVFGENHRSMLQLPSSIWTGTGLPPLASAVRSGAPCTAVTPVLPRGAPVSALSRSQYFLYSAARPADRATMELLVCAQSAREVQLVEPNCTALGPALPDRIVNLLCRCDCPA